MSIAIPEYANTKHTIAILQISRVAFDKWRRLGYIPPGRKVGDQRIHHLPTLLRAVRRNGLRVSPAVAELIAALPQEPVTANQ